MLRELPAIGEQGWDWTDQVEALAEYFSGLLQQGGNEALHSRRIELAKV